jgi:hypothetical protein
MATKSNYGFSLLGGMPVMVLHTFESTPDGQLAHYTDGTLRATVPPEGWPSYCQQYPDAQDVVDAMTIKPLADRVDEQLANIAQNAVDQAVGGQAVGGQQ